MAKFAIPASDQILRQFLQISDDIIAAATTQEDFLACFSSNWKYGKSLKSLRLLVEHNLSLVVETLGKWRQNTHRDISQRYGGRTDRERLLVLCKRGAMEIIFLESALEILGEYDDSFFSCKEFVSFYENLQQAVFRWLINGEDLIPNELTNLRTYVVDTSARLVGASSRINLLHSLDHFIRLLNERVGPKRDAKEDPNTARIQSIRLAGGMRYVSLSFRDDAQLRAAASFLRRAHPLAHTAAARKSQLHHAICEMLTSTLAPLVRQDRPHALTLARRFSPAAAQEWFSAVHALRADIYQWVVKHPKHIAAGYPLFTSLVCLSDDEAYAAGLDMTLEFLHKSMRGGGAAATAFGMISDSKETKETRVVCVRCLVLLAVSYVARYGHAMPNKHELYKWLERALRPVLTAAKKGSLTIQEQLDVMLPLIELAPEFVMERIILDLLQSDQYECVIASLKALAAI
eukprot:CAMPEP_0175040278 /NCGR_PEP_ID=MMETSP0052_2-20121109/1162_1 /TAXON_ID=51329 ORGANISM="Polytomella parva, Strain SAG 63-3" /NCGR_SAMPLE_ID=MMETSP0052_2 /ASSEMBLY_ACC=CAM_ASM_000194 /LENGTH=460 /DNA_ID=CAMNT_0016302447 /DNA_START=21 /DNA_END=1400 /DNA_ORIENTATION=-